MVKDGVTRADRSQAVWSLWDEVEFGIYSEYDGNFSDGY